MESAIKKIEVKNFTVFPKATFEFSPQLNVIAGENGSGKSHLLKLAYCILNAMSKKRDYVIELDESLVHMFRVPWNSLISRMGNFEHSKDPHAHIYVSFLDPLRDFDFTIANVSIGCSQRFLSIAKPPVFIPTRELLSIFPNFVSLYEKSEVEFEGTWRDICVHLGFPPDREITSPLLPILEDLMGGKIVSESGRFYLQIPGQERMEMHLVAEGLRKLGMIARLVANGSLAEGTHLFWDEPEANLNPKIIKDVARIILHLCNSGVQVFIATHSLFLMREIDILLQSKEFAETKVRFFGLQPGKKGYRVEQGDNIDSISTIDALDEELNQSDRYLEVEHAHANNR